MSIVSVFLQRNYNVVCRVGGGSPWNLGEVEKAEEKADHVIHYDPPPIAYN